MHGSFKSHIALVAREHSELRTPELLDDTVGTKDTTLLAVPTMDDALCITGTYEELLTFAAEIMRAVYLWCMITGHTDWFDDELLFSNGGMTVNASTRDDRDKGSHQAG